MRQPIMHLRLGVGQNRLQLTTRMSMSRGFRPAIGQTQDCALLLCGLPARSWKLFGCQILSSKNTSSQTRQYSQFAPVRCSARSTDSNMTCSASSLAACTVVIVKTIMNCKQRGWEELNQAFNAARHALPQALASEPSHNVSVAAACACAVQMQACCQCSALPLSDAPAW